MFGYSALELFIIIAGAIFVLGAGLYLRFAPTYISNRSKRYIHPTRKGVRR